MSLSEKSLVLTLVKIFNWDDPRSSDHFEFTFISLKTGALISTKRIRGIITQQEIQFNYSLKVSFLYDEHEIVIKLAHYLPQRSMFVPLAQFPLNLRLLSKKKLMFFPFGKNDKVLKIAVNQSSNQKERPKVSKISFSSKNQQFIREKEEFLRKLTNTSASSFFQQRTDKTDSQKSRKGFSERAYDLLQQVQALKQKAVNPPADIQQQFNDYYSPSCQQFPESKQRSIVKCSSQHQMGIKRQGKIQRQSQQEWDRQSSRSQKHKLLLKDLKMIPLQNEYYDELVPLVKPGGRRSDVQVTNRSAPKQRLFKSQFY